MKEVKPKCSNCAFFGYKLSSYRTWWLEQDWSVSTCTKGHRITASEYSFVACKRRGDPKSDWVKRKWWKKTKRIKE